MGQRLRQLAQTLFWPLSKVLLRLPFMKIGDRYERMTMSIPLQRLGAPHARAFVDYLAGPSHVAVESLDDIEAWLRECRYLAAPERSDDWTTLTTRFETTRIGNCLDHALWAWRKMREVGYVPELVVGVADPNDRPHDRHAWVSIHDGDKRWIVEAITKLPGHPMIKPSALDRDIYWPEIGVDSEGTPFGYTGMIRYFRHRANLPWQDA